MVDQNEQYHLLIADDDAGFRDALRQVFEPWFELVEAESGEEALAIVEYQPVDIALFDMHMHALTGLETIRILKQSHAIVPCILITSDASEQLRLDAGAVDAFSVLKKPVSRRDLMQTVRFALEETYDDEIPFHRRSL